MDTELKEQAILNRVFDTNQLNTTTIGTASDSSGTDTLLKEQAIWNRVYDEATDTIRVVTV